MLLVATLSFFASQGMDEDEVKIGYSQTHSHTGYTAAKMVRYICLLDTTTTHTDLNRCVMTLCDAQDFP